MPRENIIAGGLEGDGIEGHKKREKKMHSQSDVMESRSSGERREESSDSPFGTGFGDSKPAKKAAGGLASGGKTDIFETEFGSVRSAKGYRKNSSIGSDSDIFSNGFGSKDAGWMSGRKGKSPEKRPESLSEEKNEPVISKKETADIFETGIAKHPLESDDAVSMPERYEKAESKESNDPFYTGFGYTDQRNQETSPTKSSLKSAMHSEASSKHKEEPKKSFSKEEDDLFS